MNSGIRNQLLTLVKQRPALQERLMRFTQDSRDETTIYLGFQQRHVPRYGYGKPPHEGLFKLINKNRDAYKNTLSSFLRFKEHLVSIPAQATDATSPEWLNHWLPCADAIALYSFLTNANPKRYYEVGSGNSTKFARQAINDHRLRTKILSIDPQPRAEIDTICDSVIRKPLEDVDLSILDELEAGDILFIDSSHSAYMNSDVTVEILEVLPKLKPGILVQIHDIFLPYDYPPDWVDTYCNEQYLLAAYLLGSASAETALPNAFIEQDPDLKAIRNQIIDAISGANPAVPDLSALIRNGGASFWLITK